jgi:hypothetical protein
MTTVARSRQVYIERLEATVLSTYLPEEKRMDIRPAFLPEAVLLPEATFPLGSAQLNPQLPRHSWSIRTYARTSLRIATQTRPIHNNKVVGASLEKRDWFMGNPSPRKMHDRKREIN